MKKFLLVMAAVLGMAVVAAAQPRAIGVRAGYGAELSYQHTLGAQNFGELDLGWSAGYITGAFAYDFSITPSSPVNFYAGPQVTAALFNNPSKFYLGAGAQLGIEYKFSFPLQLSLDWRPTFWLVPATSFHWSSIALGIRYYFQ